MLHLLKQLAFHELYVRPLLTQMEKIRSEICLHDYFDYQYTFKFIDHFKHNMVTPYELYSFFESQNVECSKLECQLLIRSLNKGL